MNLPVVFRPIAKQEMVESIAWYESRRSGLGIEFAEAIETLIGRISHNPEQFRGIRGSVRRAVLHRLPYTIHFLDVENQIIVLAVFHLKRNPGLLEGR